MKTPINVPENEATSSIEAVPSVAFSTGMRHGAAALDSEFEPRPVLDSLRNFHKSTVPDLTTGPPIITSEFDEAFEAERMDTIENQATGLSSWQVATNALSEPSASDLLVEMRVSAVVPMRMAVIADGGANPEADDRRLAKRFFEHIVGATVGAFVFFCTSILWGLLIALTWITLAVAFHH